MGTAISVCGLSKQLDNSVLQLNFVIVLRVNERSAQGGFRGGGGIGWTPSPFRDSTPSSTQGYLIWCYFMPYIFGLTILQFSKGPFGASLYLF